MNTGMLQNAATALALPTYDGSGQCVHPDVISADHTPYRASWVMVMEPYPFAQAEYENPSILISKDGLSWSIPPGLKNPVAPQKPGAGWHSDAALLYRPDIGLSLYYRYNSGAGETSLLMRTSRDGTRWSDEHRLLFFPVSGRFASPSLHSVGEVVRLVFVDTLDESIWMMESDDGEAWSAPERLLTFAGAWHVCARRVDERLYLLINDRRELHLLRSDREGAKWERAEESGWSEDLDDAARVPLLAPPASDQWDSAFIYHGSFAISGNRVRVWYSARSQYGEWRIGHACGRLER